MHAFARKCVEEGDEALFEDESDITNLVESRIEAAMREGDFENLKNKGRPLPAGRPTTALEYTMRMMRNNGVRPQWLQVMHDIDREGQLRCVLVESCRLRKAGVDGGIARG